MLLSGSLYLFKPRLVNNIDQPLPPAFHRPPSSMVHSTTAVSSSLYLDIKLIRSPIDQVLSEPYDALLNVLTGAAPTANIIGMAWAVYTTRWLVPSTECSSEGRFWWFFPYEGTGAPR